MDSIHLNIYSLVLFLNALLALVIGIYLFFHEETRGSHYYALLMTGVSLYALSDAMNLMTLRPELNILFNKVTYLGVLVLGPFWVLFTLKFAGHYRVLKRPELSLIWVFPVILYGLVLTNDFHGLVWKDLRLVNSVAGPVYEFIPGTFEYFTALYSYLCFIWGLIIMLRQAWQFRSVYLRQAVLVSLVVCFPVVINFIYLLGLSPLKGVDPTTIGFTLSGLLSLFVIFKLKIYDLQPIARDFLFNEMKDGVIVVDLKNRIVDMNPSAGKIFQTRPGEGMNISAFLPGWARLTENQDKVQSMHDEINLGEASQDNWFDLVINPFFDHKQQIKGYLVVMRDINERIVAEKLLKKSEADLKELNSMKDMFFSILAHDILTPLHSILGFAEILTGQYKEFSESEREKVFQNLNDSALTTYKLFNDLNDWARLRRGGINFSPAVLALKKSSAEVVALLSVQASQKGIRLIDDVDPSLTVFADENVLLTILRNLVSNSIKFTFTGGSVTVGTSGYETGDNGIFVKVTVTDTGVGIPAGKIGDLFRLDKKIQTAGTNQEKGSGLGLIIVSELVKMQGGQLWVESEEGKGSRFNFTVPARAE